MLVLLVACSPPDFVEREAAYADDGEGIAWLESAYVYDDNSFSLAPMGGAITSSRQRPALLHLDGERLDVELQDGFELGWRQNMYLGQHQPRWVRSQGYLVVGATVAVDVPELDITHVAVAAIVDDASGETLWTTSSTALPTPDGASVVTTRRSYTDSTYTLVWFDGLTGQEQAAHSIDLPEDLYTCQEGFGTDGRFRLSCWLDSERVVFAVDQQGTLETTATLDPCAVRQQTSSSAWASDGRSVWDAVGTGPHEEARYIDLNTGVADACAYPSR